jgi:hypothetical protein
MTFKKSLYLSVCFSILPLCSCNDGTAAHENSSSDDEPQLIDNTKKEAEAEAINASISALSFKKSSNKGKISEDIRCKVHNEHFECFPKETLKSNSLAASFEFAGDSILFNGDLVESDKTVLSYNDDMTFSVYSGTSKKDYKVHLYPYTGLPYIAVETANGKDITDKVNLREASLRIMEYPDRQELGGSIECSIIGRGNSTWTMPKKPYQIKFNTKTSPLSLPKGKTWVMVANYFDKTMVRNSTAMYLSSISSAPYTPKYRNFELILNGKHKGTYQLFEKLAVSKKRINIGEKDFLLEVDNHSRLKDTYFTLDSLPNPVKIHSPSVSIDDEDYNYIKKRMENIENVLFSDDFLDEEKGYRNYIDIDALVEWFIVTEITENSSNRVNWFMTFKREGKLKFGPFWDYDLAFGNSLWTPYANELDRIWMLKLPWFKRFMKDPEFKKKVAERFDYFYSRKDDILRKVDDYANEIWGSVIANNNLWNVLECDSCTSEQVYRLYDEELSYMKSWLSVRMENLKQKFDTWAQN